jgi:hypothetical protein
MAENLHPGHLVQWTRLAYNSDPAEPFGDFTGLTPWQVPAGPVPPYPVASNQREMGGTTVRSEKKEVMALREEIRRLVIEELALLTGG